MGARKRPAARCAEGDADAVLGEESTLEAKPLGDQSTENPPTTPSKKPKPRKKRTKQTVTQPDNADKEDVEQPSTIQSEPSQPSGSHEDPANSQKETTKTPAGSSKRPASASAKRPASAKAMAKKGNDDSKPAAAKEKAVAKRKSRTKKTDTEKPTGGEPNPFDMPPDADQQKVSSFFPAKEKEEEGNEHPNKEGQGDEANQEPNEGTDEGEGQVAKNDGDSKSSSTSSSTTKHSHVPLLGELEDESDIMSGSPCIVQPDQIRSRTQMFSFPSRNVQRLKKHWGMDAVTNLDINLSDATVVSLYSGLGGAEIATTLLGHAVSATLTQSNPDGKRPVQPLIPQFLLACDHSNECQKVLRSHFEKPRYIVNSLEEFLAPGALEKLNDKIAAEKERCSALATQSRAAKSKAVKKDKAKLRQARAAAKQAKKDLSELSQKLVLELVNMIEGEDMLKPAMSLHPTYEYESSGSKSGSQGDTSESGNIGVPDVVGMSDIAAQKLLILVAGSTCTDWSSMGSQKGFLGKSLLAFVILCCLVRRWKPVLFLHECTRLFKWTVFDDQDLLSGYVCHSTIVNPTEYGFPINRSRAYSAILRDDWVLQVGLDQLFRLHISPGLDAGCFFAATAAEVEELRQQMAFNAKKSIQCDWQDLLPVAAQMNLKAALKLQRMQQLLKNSSEVAINLDQDVGVQEHFGAVAPVLLASITYLWGVLRGRPYTASEMIEMQGVPIFPDALFACGVSPLFNHKVVSTAALRKMAGNSFSQPCMTAFIAFVLSHMKTRTASNATIVPTASTSTRGQIVYRETLDSESDSDDDVSADETES